MSQGRGTEMAHEIEIRRGTVTANGLEFGYLEAGDGPLALLLHGFPDDPWTWSSQIEALAGAGYRAVAPFMRGYPPTQIPADGRYDCETLSADITGLIGALGEESAYIVANDWGAIATYATITTSPDSVRSAVMIAVGHPSTLLQTLTHPRQLHHIFHFWLFQTGDLAVGAARANDMALIDYLWDYWSAGHDHGEHVARVKRETLSADGALEAGIAYYPALVDLLTTNPDLVARMQGRVSVPTLSVFGEHNPPHELSIGEHVHFDGPYRFELVEGAGHFVHRDRPEAVNRLILDWFAETGSELVAGAAAADNA